MINIRDEISVRWISYDWTLAWKCLKLTLASVLWRITRLWLR